jgi:hypothetical protein
VQQWAPSFNTEAKRKAFLSNLREKTVMPEMKDGDKAFYELCIDPLCPVKQQNLPHGHLISIERADEYAGPVHVVLPDWSKGDTTRGQLEILPSDELMQLVGNYVTWVETGRTSEVCKCEWEIHPEDIDKPEGDPKRRMRRGDTSLDCPAHTKEGYLLISIGLNWIA